MEQVGGRHLLEAGCLEPGSGQNQDACRLAQRSGAVDHPRPAGPPVNVQIVPAIEPPGRVAVDTAETCKARNKQGAASAARALVAADEAIDPADTEIEAGGATETLEQVTDYILTRSA